jgi:5-hydroxyisourate hydrolase
MSLSTHVLDAGSGLPAGGMRVHLDIRDGDGWRSLASAATDSDGRIRELAAVDTGIHRLTFDTGTYFGERGVATFYPEVSVVFEVIDAGVHHHVPLLLSPYAYSTYRGS